ncbi:hypothetical protein GCM10023083_74110 [Streptomyces phyllanthi]
MSLAGYAQPGHGIAAAEHLLDLPGFWPAYYGPAWDGFAADPEPFGADTADVDAAAEALYDTTRIWPAYRLPLRDGRLLWIVHRNFPDDAGTDYLVTGPGTGGHTTLASSEGHHRGPGLSWPELTAIAESAPRDEQGIRDPDLRLLLLLPAFGAVDVLCVDEAASRISGALGTVGVPQDVAPAMADRFLDRPVWVSSSTRSG